MWYQSIGCWIYDSPLTMFSSNFINPNLKIKIELWIRVIKLLQNCEIIIKYLLRRVYCTMRNLFSISISIDYAMFTTPCVKVLIGYGYVMLLHDACKIKGYPLCCFIKSWICCAVSEIKVHCHEFFSQNFKGAGSWKPWD